MGQRTGLKRELRILVVDGDAAYRGQVVSALTSGFGEVRTVEAESSETLSRAVDEGQFDAVVTEYQPGWTDGLSVLRACRARWPRVPVLVLTDKGSEAAAARCMKAGAVDYLVKSPKSLSELREAVLRAAERGTASRDAVEIEIRYRRFLDNIPMGLYRTTESGKIADVNLALVQLLGYPDRETFMNIDAGDVYVEPGDRQKTERLVKRIGVADRELRFRRYDGSEIWVRDVCRAVRDPDGGVLYYEGSIEDITERKLAQEALRESEERYRTLIERQGEGLAIVDEEECFVFCNQVADEIFGVRPNTLQGRSLAEFVTPETYRFLQDQTLKRKEGVKSTYEVEIVRQDGQRRHLMCTATPWLGKDGRFAGAFAIFRDDTERKLAEEALKQNEEKYRAVVAQSADCIFLVDFDTRRLLEANPALQRLLGYSEEEMAHLALDDFVAHSKEDINEKIDRVAAGRWYFLGERKYRRKDGRLVDVEVSASLISYGGKDVICVVSRDIAERKKAEEALRISREQLRQSQQLDAVGRLAGGVAHDFNNIMGGILGYCELALKRTREGDPVRKEIVEIKAAAERAASLTRQLLAFSRRQSIRTRVLDLPHVISGMEGLLRRLVGHGIEFLADFGRDSHPVRADQGQVEQVLLNLVLNSRDAMPGGGRIRVSVQNIAIDETDRKAPVGARPGRFACLSVEDTGLGMDPEVLDRVFEPFFTTKGPGKGTGLGLSTVYGIVKQHDGWLTVESEPGVGSIFSVYLPAHEPEEQTVSGTESAVAGQGRRVLLVEPDDASRNDTARVLRDRGYEVVEVSSAGEASDCFRDSEEGFDLLLASLKLPDRNGIHLADELCNRKPSLSVLLCGHYSDEELRLTVIPERKYGYLRKPFRSGDVLRAVATALGSGPVAGAGPDAGAAPGSDPR